MAAAATPNNYIGTDNNGVISERLGNNANIIITRDMSTQAELEAVQAKSQQDAAFFWDRTESNKNEIYRVDQEDHRVVNASVNEEGDLVLHSQDMDGGSKRNITTDANVKGQDGTNGTNGTDGLDGISGLSLTASLGSFSGTGFGVGVAGTEGVLEISLSAAVSVQERGRAIMGITHDQVNNRTMGTVGFGWSF